MLTTLRGARALQYGAVVLDGDREGPSFFKRASKYQERGWRVAVPGFEQVKMKPSITNANYYHLPKSQDLLLKGTKPPELLGGRGENVRVRMHLKTNLPPYSGKQVDVFATEIAGKNLEQRAIKVKCSLMQQCDIVRGIEYLLAKTYGKVKTSLHTETLTCVPLIQNKSCVLLWCQRPGETDESDLSCVSTSLVDHLLDKSFEHQVMEEMSTDEDEWWRGGALRKGTVVTKLRESIITQLNTNDAHIDFVYDFVSGYNDFKFVLDAGRSPLTATGSEARFFETYGIEPCLSFELSSPRSPLRSDWWTEAYLDI